MVVTRKRIDPARLALATAVAVPARLRSAVVPAAPDRDGRRPHPDIELLLGIIAAGNRRASAAGPITSARRARREFVAQSRIVGGNPPIGAVTDRTIDGPDGAIGLRFYTPRGLTESSPGLVFLHGGGFVLGDLDSHDALCRVLAEQGQLRVVAVDYRLAPEHPFPAAVDDAIAAWRWVYEHADTLNLLPEHVAIGGDSAGGNLAAVVTAEMVHSAGPVPAAQLLIYPVVDFTTHRHSRELYGQGYFLTTDFIDQVVEAYLLDSQDRADPRVSPLLGDLHALPPTVVATAGFDPLRDEGLAYVDALRAAGVLVESVPEDGLIHGYASMVGYGTACPAAATRLVAALQRALV